MNYNAASKSASKYFLPIGPATATGNSAVCNNCYGYLGAGILIHFSYSVTYGLQFEVKLAGSAGFSVDVDIVNPTSAGPATVDLVKAQDITQASSFMIPNTGLTLSYWFGGMKATVQGTGTGTGTIRGTVGGDVSLSAYALMSGVLAPDFKAGVTAPQGTVTPPVVYASSDFKPASNLDASITVTPTLNMNIAFGPKNVEIGITFYVSMPATNELIYTKPVRRRLEDHETTMEAASLESYLVKIGSDKTTFYPGEIIPVSYVYSNMNPNEKTVLYYSFMSSSGSKFKVLQREFTSNDIGSGSFDTNIFLSWNSWFESHGNLITIEVHASTHILQPVIGPTITVAMFTDKDSVFTNAPIDGSIVNVESPILLEWNPQLLQYFEPVNTNPFHGSTELTNSILLSLVGESYNQNGTLVSTTKTLLAGPLNNTGSATVTIPSSVIKPNTHFYLTLGSSRFSDVNGWSAGYFTVTDTAAQLSMTQLVLVTPATSKKTMIMNARMISTYDSSLLSSYHGRKLAACESTSQVAVKSDSNVGSGISAITFKLAGIGMSFQVPSQGASTSVLKGSDCVYPKAYTPYVPPPTPSEDSSSLSGGGIAGIVIGVLISVALIALAIYKCYYQPKYRRDPTNLGDVTSGVNPLGGGATDPTAVTDSGCSVLCCRC